MTVYLVVGSATNGHVRMMAVDGSAGRFKVDTQARHLTAILDNGDLIIQYQEIKINSI